MSFLFFNHFFLNFFYISFLFFFTIRIFIKLFSLFFSLLFYVSFAHYFFALNYSFCWEGKEKKHEEEEEKRNDVWHHNVSLLFKAQWQHISTCIFYPVMFTFVMFILFLFLSVFMFIFFTHYTQLLIFKLWVLNFNKLLCTAIFWQAIQKRTNIFIFGYYQKKK